MDWTVTLPRDSNQALGIGQFAIDFLSGALGPGPSDKVLERAALFHTDSVLCGISALTCGTNAPCLLRKEALQYPDPSGATVFGSKLKVKPEKAILANSAAVREWDCNGTNFGYNPARGHTAGEFGHNDYYPVVIAACQQRGLDGAMALKGMVLLDEIRGRLAEVFSLNTYKIDHVVHGAIASAATYGALMGATAEQIESAIGQFVAHFIPWRAIRAGNQLSDSKGASAAISAEVAIVCAKRAMAGFEGPKDIFRNPESMFRQFVKTDGSSPFDLILTHSGDDFAVIGMHFKLGLYEHQSAGALQGVIDLIEAHPQLLEEGRIARVLIRAYQPAFGIIGDPAKRDPRTRQSADHSMVYIVACSLWKAMELRDSLGKGTDEAWKLLPPMPPDYNEDAIFDPEIRKLMALVEFEHGGPEYDAKYPDGIPTSVEITDVDGNRYDSGLVMYPAGHARNTTADLRGLLAHKFKTLGMTSLPFRQDVDDFIRPLQELGAASAEGVDRLYEFEVPGQGA